jgi:hypothetical protein
LDFLLVFDPHETSAKLSIVSGVGHPERKNYETKKKFDCLCKSDIFSPMNKITLSLLFVALVALGSSRRNYGTKEDLFRAMAQVESSGNPKAINAKETALGIYQIRPMYFLDAGVSGPHTQVYDPAVARKVCERYFMRYEPKAFANNDIETLARLHNGGPNWRKKNTDKYWNKIKKHL